jgi:hypothetical protein
MERTPQKEHGPQPQLTASILPLFHPNPGKTASGLPVVPMWNAKDGMSFPQMQDKSEMLKKNNTAMIAVALS